MKPVEHVNAVMLKGNVPEYADAVLTQKGQQPLLLLCVFQNFDFSRLQIGHNACPMSALLLWYSA